MAWTDACKVEACAQIDKHKEKEGSIVKALEKISAESGIPIATLKRWYYPDSYERYEEKRPPRKMISLGSETDSLLKQIDKADEKQKIRQVNEIKNKKKEEKRKLHQEENEKLAKQYVEEDAIKILHGDFYELCKDIDQNSIDLILTDPPYPEEYIHVWKQLGEVSARVLKPSSFLVCYSGHIYPIVA